MTEKSLIQLLSSIPIGNYIAVIGVFGAIVGTVSTLTIKLYKLFTKYHNLQEKDKKQEDDIKRHEAVILEMKTFMTEIKQSLDEQKVVNYKQLRYTIVHACDEALYQGYITAGKLKSLEEMYEEYVDIFHGNGYVKTLMIRVRELPIRGSLDE